VTLQDYINALDALPLSWKESSRETIPLAFLGEILVAACGNRITGFDPSDGTWKDPTTIRRESSFETHWKAHQEFVASMKDEP
jgi:hypothetical protein